MYKNFLNEIIPKFQNHQLFYQKILYHSALAFYFDQNFETSAKLLNSIDLNEISDEFICQILILKTILLVSSDNEEFMINSLSDLFFISEKSNTKFLEILTEKGIKYILQNCDEINKLKSKYSFQGILLYIHFLILNNQLKNCEILINNFVSLTQNYSFQSLRNYFMMLSSINMRMVENSTQFLYSLYKLTEIYKPHDQKQYYFYLQQMLVSLYHNEEYMNLEIYEKIFESKFIEENQEEISTQKYKKIDGYEIDTNDIFYKNRLNPLKNNLLRIISKEEEIQIFLKNQLCLE